MPSKGCGNKSVYLQIVAILRKYTDLLPYPLLHLKIKISLNILGEGDYNQAVIWLDKADSIPLASADVREGIKVSRS